MALNIDIKLPTTQQNFEYLTLSNFKRGVITLIDESRLPNNALKEANNIFLYEDGMPGPRPGVDWYGVVTPNAAAIQGAEYYTTSADATHIVIAAGGNIYRSTDNADSWTICSGGTVSTTADVNFVQNGGYLYITTGVDNILRYDGSTTLVAYTTLTTPAAPTIVETGLTGTAYSYYYKCARVNEIGFSEASVASAVVQSDIDRVNWDATTNKATLTVPALSGTQTRTDIYVSDGGVDDYYYLGSTSTTTFVDDGTYAPVPGSTAPTQNTTTGPRVAELTQVGGRMFGVRDTDNPYRIWFSGEGNLAGSFSSSYGGGWLDWQLGGKEKPTHVEDYRDGKGTPYATVWNNTQDGQGSIVQMNIELLTIGDISINVPTAYRLPGSRGTPAPYSVVNVLNDYMFYNSQAIYNLGSRAQFLNLLSTDEATSNIRPSIKQINPAAEHLITAIYHDARVLVSYPAGSSVNNKTAVYDTERQAWLPQGFTIGFKKFLKYTENDAAKTRRLLAYKPGDNKLSYIDYNLSSDYGLPISTSLITGLYPVSKNRFDFQSTEEGELELSNPQGQITVELLGIERSKGYRTLKTQSVTTTTVDAGWDFFAWDTEPWDDTSEVPSTFSESSIKRYFRVQKELNAVQWRITTNTVGSKYVLRTLQSFGRPTLAGKPRQWRI